MEVDIPKTVTLCEAGPPRYNAIGIKGFAVPSVFKRKIIVGVDTAVTADKFQDEKFRRREGLDKLYIAGNFLIFVCGVVDIGLHAVADFRQTETKTTEALQSIIKSRYRDYISAYPEELLTLTEENDSLLSVVAFESRANGEVVSHSFNPGTAHEIVTRDGIKDGTHVVSGGVSSKKANELTIKLFTTGKYVYVDLVIKEVFEKMSGSGIGGELTLYVVDSKGAHLIKREPINEILTVKRLEEYYNYFVDDRQRENIINPISDNMFEGTLSPVNFESGWCVPTGSLVGGTVLEYVRMMLLEWRGLR